MSYGDTSEYRTASISLTEAIQEILGVDGMDAPTVNRELSTFGEVVSTGNMRKATTGWVVAYRILWTSERIVLRASWAVSLVLVLAGCGNTSEQENSDIQEDTALTEVLSTDESANAVPKDSFLHEPSNFNVDSIRKYTATLTEEIAVRNDVYEYLEWIPENFLRQHIAGLPISNVGSKLVVDYPDSYKFQEFKEFENFYLVSFLYRDESCCRFLYYLTLEKDPLKTIEICLVGYTGGDGGWVGEKLGKWASKDRIELTETSGYDPDLINGPNLEQDTVWSEISLDRFGSFTEVELKSVKYKGGQRIK